MDSNVLKKTSILLSPSGEDICWTCEYPERNGPGSHKFYVKKGFFAARNVAALINDMRRPV